MIKSILKIFQFPAFKRNNLLGFYNFMLYSGDLDFHRGFTYLDFMAGNTIHKIAAKAIAEGRDPFTPVALVHNVSLPDQTEFITDLKSLSLSETKYPTPIIIVIGYVVESRKEVQIPAEMLVEANN